MPDLIEDVRIDAKHSFEDVIVPVEEFKQRWGARVAVLGGVDVDLLSRGTEEDVRRRTRQILEACAPGGGYACGSGNSITNYMPTGNYLAMIEIDPPLQRAAVAKAGTAHRKRPLMPTGGHSGATAPAYSSAASRVASCSHWGLSSARWR